MNIKYNKLFFNLHLTFEFLKLTCKYLVIKFEIKLKKFNNSIKNYDIEISMVENSDILKHILNTVITVSGRKTNESHAVFVMEKVMKKLEKRYNFLKNVAVKDTTFLEEGEPVSIMANLDSISKKDLGKALYEIIFTINKSLGEDAGHFFIREIAVGVQSEISSIMKDIGVDFNLMQLEYEINEMEKRVFSRKTE